MKFDNILSAPSLPFGSGEKSGTETTVTKQVADSPLCQGQHAPPLAKNDNLPALVQYDLPYELSQLDQLGRRQTFEHIFVRGASGDCRPYPLEVKLSHAVRNDPLGRQQLHQLEKLGLSQRTLERPCHELRNRLVQIVVRDHLVVRHVDRDAGVGSRRQLIEHILSDPAHHAVPEAVANRIEIASADDLAAAVGPRRMQRV